MKTRLTLAALAVALFGAPALADADVTAFVGVNGTPSNRITTGLSVGISVLVVGFEFEYASAREEDLTGAPGVRTGMFNLLVQTPFAVSGVQVYGTAGVGVYHETLGDTHALTNVGTNVGGGVKLSLVGPLRLRLDYRVLLFRGQPLYSKSQRFYAGINLAF